MMVGPGCSSVGIGAFGENGPFKFIDKGLEENKFSWNTGKDCEHSSVYE